MLRVVPVAPLLGVLALVLAAYTALARPDVTRTGEGVARVGGIHVRDLRFELAEADPTVAVGLSFATSPASGSIEPRATVDDVTWDECRAEGDRYWCTFAQPRAVRSLQQVRVVVR